MGGNGKSSSWQIYTPFNHHTVDDGGGAGGARGGGGNTIIIHIMVINDNERQADSGAGWWQNGWLNGRSELPVCARIGSGAGIVSQTT